MQKFILIDTLGIVILTDYKYWTDNQEKLNMWCLIHGAVCTGMCVKLKSFTDITLFALEFT